MKERNLNTLLLKYNSIMKKNEDIFHEVSLKFGLSECSILILYVIRMGDKLYSQSMICNELYMPKQTINSALKKLEQDNYIELRYSSNDKKRKMIYLTDKGIELTVQTIDKMIEAEKNAFSHLEVSEQDMFLSLYEKYVHHLHDEMRITINK